MSDVSAEQRLLEEELDIARTREEIAVIVAPTKKDQGDGEEAAKPESTTTSK